MNRNEKIAKLYEELLIGSDVIQSEHPRIMQAKERKLSFKEVLHCVEIIKLAREKQDERARIGIKKQI